MKKLLIIILIINALTAFAQVPGYQGNRSWVELEVGYAYGFGGITVIDGNFANINLPISLQYNYALKRKGFISLKATRATSKFDTYYNGDNFNDNFRTKVSAYGLGADWHFGRGNATLAPIGNFWNIGVQPFMVTSKTQDIEGKSYKGQSAILFNFNVGYTIRRPLTKKIAYAYGFRYSFNPKAISTITSTSVNEAKDIEPYITEQAPIALAGSMMFQAFIAVGGLFR